MNHKNDSRLVVKAQAHVDTSMAAQCFGVASCAESLGVLLIIKSYVFSMRLLSLYFLFPSGLYGIMETSQAFLFFVLPTHSPHV